LQGTRLIIFVTEGEFVVFKCNGTEVLSGMAAGDFLSGRKAARAERYTPKTIAAALDG